MRRQEATPSKQVCQENRLKVGLGVGERRKGTQGLPLPSISNLSPLDSAFPMPPSWCPRTQATSPLTGN